MDLHFHHLGMACRKIATELPELAIVGYSPEGPIFEDPIQQVRIQFVSGGGPRLELIEPASAQSPVEGILKRRSKFYHLGYEVDRLDDAIAYFRERQYFPVSSPAPAVAFGATNGVHTSVPRSISVSDIHRVVTPDDSMKSRNGGLIRPSNASATTHHVTASTMHSAHQPVKRHHNRFGL